MDEMWAGLYVLGFVMPGIVLVASTVAVLRLAGRLRRSEPSGRPPWQYLALHLTLGLALTIPLGPLGTAVWLVVPGYLYAAVRRAALATGREATLRPLTSASASERLWGLGVLFTATGMILPWATGLGVKLYLDSRGRPTLPLGGFLDPASIAIELLLTLGAWAFPFVLLATAVVVPWRIGFPVDSPSRSSLLPIWLAYAGGVVTCVPVFAAVFWEFDSMMLLVPVGCALVPSMAVGYFVGWWLLRGRDPTLDGAQARRAPSPPAPWDSRWDV